MVKVTVSDVAAFVSGYELATWSADGFAEHSCFSPPGFALWRTLGRIGKHATLSSSTGHGDEAIYVSSGCLRIVDSSARRDSSMQASPGSVVLIDAGVAVSLQAAEDTQFIHFGPSSIEAPAGLLGPAALEGRGVRVIDEGQADAVHGMAGSPTSSLYFADGSRPSSRITVFLVDARAVPGGYIGSSHSHSEAEIIHVTRGAINIGSSKIRAGHSVAIGAEVRYQVRAEQPFQYLNYRRDVSLLSSRLRSEPILETAAELRRSFT